MTDSDVLSVAEAAKRLGIHTHDAYRLAAKGQLPGAFKVGIRRWRVSRAAFERFLADPSSPAASTAHAESAVRAAAAPSQRGSRLERGGES